jgi:hypothetical protein
MPVRPFHSKRSTAAVLSALTEIAAQQSSVAALLHCHTGSLHVCTVSLLCLREHCEGGGEVQVRVHCGTSVQLGQWVA